MDKIKIKDEKLKNKSANNILSMFLFYSIVSLTGIIVLPTLGIIAPTFMLCGVITPIAGIIKLIGYIFNIDMPFIMFQIGELTLNPILGFLLSIFIGVILYILGTYAWKLLLGYIHIVSDKKKKMEI